MSNYTKTTDFDVKDSLPSGDTGKIIRGSEFETEFDNISTAIATKADANNPALTGSGTANNLSVTGTLTAATVDINGGAIDGTSVGSTSASSGAFTTLSATGNITVGGTVDGRDVAADGAKLDGIEAGADVTDTANVTAAGALMDSELTNIAAVKGLNQGVATTDNVTFASVTADTATIGSGSGALINTAADDLIVDNAGSGGITVATGAANFGSLFFSDSGNSVAGYVQYSHGTDYMRFGTAATERMRIDASGNVGIGTTSPTVKFEVQNNGAGAADVARFLRANGAAISFLDITPNPDDAEVILDCSGSTAQTLVFRSGGTEHMRLDSSGNLLVGAIVSPATMLTDGYSGFAVDGTNDYIVSSRFNNIAAFFKRENSDGAVVAFYKDGTSVGTISVTASTTSYNTSSDVRLKENITDAPQGTVDALQVRSFDWKADGSHQEYGFIAQELEPVAPYAVTKGETEDDMWSVDYSKLVPMLVKEIQQLRARVATLERTN